MQNPCHNLAGVAVLVLSALPAIAQDQPDGGYGAFADIAVTDIVGQDVLSPAGEDVGEVEELVSTDGTVLAVLGVGGFLGLGEHDVAVPLTELAPAEGALMLQGLDAETLKGMPAYEDTGEPLPLDVTVAGDPVATEAPAETAPTE